MRKRYPAGRTTRREILCTFMISILRTLKTRRKRLTIHPVNGDRWPHINTIASPTGVFGQPGSSLTIPILILDNPGPRHSWPSARSVLLFGWDSPVRVLHVSIATARVPTGVSAGDTQALPPPLRGSYHSRIGRALSSASLTNSALPQSSRVIPRRET